MKQSFRYANIGIAVGSAVVFGGAFIFRHAGDGALQAVALAGFIVTFTVYNVLDDRARRKRSQ
jgi:hypothetical protein